MGLALCLIAGVVIGALVTLLAASASSKQSAWLVSELRQSLKDSKQQADFANLSEKMVLALAEMAKKHEKLDLSVGNLIARTFSPKPRQNERQVGEPDTETPYLPPDPLLPQKKMYEEGFVTVEGRKIPETASAANVRAFGKPT